jgi:hypothetical protein
LCGEDAGAACELEAAGLCASSFFSCAKKLPVTKRITAAANNNIFSFIRIADSARAQVGYVLRQGKLSLAGSFEPPRLTQSNSRAQELGLKRKKMREGHFEFWRNAPGMAGTSSWSCGKIVRRTKWSSALALNRVGEPPANLKASSVRGARMMPISAFEYPYNSTSYRPSPSTARRALWQTCMPNVEISQTWQVN